MRRRRSAIMLGLAQMVILGAALPAGAQDLWEAQVAYERQNVRTDLPQWKDWEAWRVSARGHWDQANIALQGIYTRRFGHSDVAAAADGYLNLTSRTYLHGHLRVAPGAGAIPEQDHRVELFHAHPRGWEGSFGYRFMDVVPRNVHVLNLSLARYVGEWYLRARGDVNPTFDEAGFFAAATARRFLRSPPGHLDATLGAGEEVVEVGPGATVDLRASRFAGITAQLFPWRSVGVAGELAYHWLAGVPSRVGVGATIIFRW